MDEESNLKEIDKTDRDRPTLFAFFFMEFLKWGLLLLIAYVIFNFTEPLWGPVYEYIKWLVSGADSPGSATP